ncbi:MAG: 50S ribosomal protein L14e [Nanoarchaeota archaeon]|nr:50S ribosomal protein L14e [Nanoarchaeota archaeon]
MIEVGRLVVKIAGRDADLKGIVVEILENNYVLIDGQVRRRKCNIMHLEPLDKVLKIPKKATHEEVVAALKKEGIEVKAKKKKEAEKGERPRKQRKTKKKEVAEEAKEIKPKEEKVKKETKVKEVKKEKPKKEIKDKK